MMHKIKKKRLYAILYYAAAVIISFLIAIWNSNADVEYCKNCIRYEDGAALINEGKFTASILSFNEQGKITGRVNLISTNFFTSSIKNFNTLFTDDQGNLYVSCSVYSDKNEQEYMEVYKCNFQLGYAQRVWRISCEEGYSFVSSCVPSIYAQKLYISIINDKTEETAAAEYDKNGEVNIIEQPQADKPIQLERIIYTPDGTAIMTMQDGVYLNDEKIYPQNSDDSCIINGLNYDNGMICFADISNEAAVVYDPSKKEITKSKIESKQCDYFQSMRVYSDAGIYTCEENGSQLFGGIYVDNKLKVYNSLSGYFSLEGFVLTLAVLLAAALVLRIVWAIFFVRIKRTETEENNIKFISVASKITAVSLAASFLFVGIFSAGIYSYIKKIDEYWISSDSVNSVQYLGGYISGSLDIYGNEKTVGFDNKNRSMLEKTIEDYKDELSNKGIDKSYDFIVLLEYNEQTLCIYSNEFSRSMPAELVVSLNTLDKCKDSMLELSRISFEDKRSIGILKYTAFSFSMNTDEGETYPVCVCAVTDGYKEKLSAIETVPTVAALISALSFTILLAVNIVLRIMFLKVKKLRKALDKYAKNNDAQGFDIKGGDEISQTAQAFKSMAKGIEMYSEDINRGNLNYQRLISGGIIALIQREGISKISPGEFVSHEGISVRFITEQCADINEFINQIKKFCGINNGYLLNFGKEKADIFFKSNSGCQKIIAGICDLIKEEKISVYMSYGNIQAGRAGNGESCRLCTVSQVYNEFDRLYSLYSHRKTFFVHKYFFECIKNDFKDQLEILQDDTQNFDYYEIVYKVTAEDPLIRQ